MDDVNATNNSSIQADTSFNSSLHNQVCPNVNFFIMLGFLFISVLLCLPLFILVLFVGFQRWRKQRSVTTSATMSHCDFFTYNVVSLELMGILGCFISIYRNFNHIPILFEVGLSIFSIVSNGQTVFHVLTCVERYLAVVHPITYISLRQASAVKIRNISTGCIWLLLIASQGLNKVPLNDFDSILSMVFMVICTILVIFCSLSVLCVLIRSTPGDRNVTRERERVDQSKLRAFHTIMAIMGALLLRFMTIVISHIIYLWSVPTKTNNCDRVSWSYWFTLPSALVLPLLFLQRAGKLPGCKHNSE